jgi:hypothetical protein
MDAVNFRAAFTNNVVLKATSLLLAVGAWFVAQGEQIYPTTIDAPVDYLWPEPDPGGRRLILMNDKAPPNPVRLQVSGTRAAVNRLRERTRENEVRYVVDLREAQPGPAIHSFLRPPGGVTAEVQLDTVSPAEVELVFDVVGSESVPVLLRTVGRLPTGFVETKREVLPSEITLVGSRSELARVEFIETVPLRLDSLEEGFEGSLALDLASLHLLPESPRGVIVNFGVKEATSEREFAGLPITLGPGLAGMDIAPSSCVLRLEGPVPVLEDLAATGLSVEANGDPGSIFFPEEGPATISYSAEPPSEVASPAVRVVIDHPRKDEIELRSVEPLGFRLTRIAPPEPPTPAPTPPPEQESP